MEQDPTPAPHPGYEGPVPKGMEVEVFDPQRLAEVGGAAVTQYLRAIQEQEGVTSQVGEQDSGTIDAEAYTMEHEQLDAAEPAEQLKEPEPADAEKLAKAIVDAQIKQREAEQTEKRQKSEQKQIEGFLDEPFSKELSLKVQRANWLQSNIDGVLRDMKSHRANEHSLKRILERYSQEFTELTMGDISRVSNKNFSISEGGLKLLEKGLVAGDCPTENGLKQIQTFMESQRIRRAEDIEDIVKGLSPAEIRKLKSEPRYFQLKEVEESGVKREKLDPAFGPYESPEQDMVARVQALINPDTWLLSPEDKDYLSELLQTTKITKYEAAPTPTGQKYFWNRRPMNVYIRKISKEVKHEVRYDDSSEGARQERMNDPDVQRQISLSTTITDWWNGYLGKTRIGHSAARKAKKDEILLDEAKKYASDRLNLDRQLRNL
jgi:hypothetical protein